MKERFVTSERELRHNWIRLWSIVGANGNPIETLTKIQNHYQEPHRHYHTLDHITDCLNEYYPISIFTDLPAATEMAIWLHDVVYDPTKTDNEKRSAQFAEELLTTAGLNQAFSSEVRKRILVTQHTYIPKTADERYMVDIDLAIFGKPETEFENYEENIRKEYAFVPEDIFTVARSKILVSFITRPTIYQTHIFFRNYEEQALLNLNRSFSRLTEL